MQQTQDTPASNAAPPGRRLAMAGLILLCISFFLPFPAIYAPMSITHRSASNGVGSIYISYGGGAITQSHSGMPPAAVAFLDGHALRYFTSGGLPYVFGWLGLCLYICLRRAPNEERQRFLLTARTWLCAAFLLAGVVALYLGLLALVADVAMMALSGATDEPYYLRDLVPHGALAAIVAVGFAMAFSFAVILFSRRSLRGPLGIFFCGLISSLPLGCHLGMPSDYYPIVDFVGPMVAVPACLLIAAGGLTEAITARRAGHAACIANK